MSFGRTAARDGNQVRFLPAAQLALPARPRPVVDGGFESLIDEPSPRSGDSEGAYRNRLSRLAVRQPFVSFQQRKGPLYRAGQRLAPAGYLNQIGPLGWCQFDFVLYGRHIRVRPPWKIIPKPTQSHILYQHFMEPVLARKLPTLSCTAALLPKHRFPVAASRAHPQMASSALKSGL